MSAPIDQLAALGIRIRRYRPGSNVKTLCPKCSHRLQRRLTLLHGEPLSTPYGGPLSTPYGEPYGAGMGCQTMQVRGTVRCPDSLDRLS